MGGSVMTDATIQEEMSNNQWKRGDKCYTRLYGKSVRCTVLNVDIPTRRLELITVEKTSWETGWMYMEHCWKE